MMKKIIALVLALILVFSMAACAGKNTAEDESTEETATAESDYQGALPLVQPGEDNVLTIGILVSGKVQDYDTNAYTLWLEEQTGVDIQFVQFAGKSSDAATQISLMMASGEKLPDILFKMSGIGKSDGEEFGRDGYFLDLAPYFEKYSYYQKQAFSTIFNGDMSVYETMLRRASVPNDGAIYCFPTFEEVPMDTPKSHTWINQQWLDKLGLQAPTTIEELYDVLVAFRDQDPNGNGKKDEIPIIARTDTGYADVVSWIVNAFTYYNYKTHFRIQDGKVDTPYLDDNYREALVFIKKLVDEGLMSTLTWTQTADELKSLINPPEGEPFTCGIICQHADTGFEAEHESIFAYEPIAPLKDHTGFGGYGPEDYYTMVYTTYITEDCKNPELAFKFLDFVCSEGSYMRQRWGEEGVDWEWVDGSKIGNNGQPAKFRILTPGVWSATNNSCWHVVASVASEWYYSYEVEEASPDNWDATRAAKLLKTYELCEAAGRPEEVFNFAELIPEESDELSDFESDLKEYIKTSRAEFCTGVKDPANDGDWQTYVDGVKALQYDRWVEIHQQAYDRMK